MFVLIARTIARLFRPLIMLGIIYVLFLAADPAEARGAIPYGHKENLSFVAETQIPGPGGAPLALCHLTKHYHLAFIPAVRQSRGYGLSDAGCATEAGYYEIDAQGIADAKAAGLIHRHIPLTPRLSLTEVATGFVWVWVAIAAAIAMILVAMDRRRRLTIRREILAIDNPAVFNFIDAMCHAAKADGRTAREEVEYIRDVARDLTGLEYTEQHIIEAISYCPKLSGAAQFRRFGSGLSTDQRKMILHGALSVVAADGTMTDSEKSFIGTMGKGMRLKSGDMDAVVSGFFAKVQQVRGTPA